MSNKVNKSKTNAGKSVLPMNTQHKRPSSIEPTEQDLKWCAALLAVRSAAFSLSTIMTQIATESYCISKDHRKVMTEDALIDYISSLDNRLQAAQSGFAGIISSADEYIGRDLINACKDKFHADEVREYEDTQRKFDEKYFYTLSKRLGKKVV